MLAAAQVMDTFVVGELRKQATWLDDVGPVVHWRSSEGDDGDLTVERDETAVVAFPATTSTACASCATRSGEPVPRRGRLLPSRALLHIRRPPARPSRPPTLARMMNKTSTIRRGTTAVVLWPSS